MANSLVLELYVQIDFGTFCEHGRIHLDMRIENEHLALSSSASDESALFLSEGTALIESNLHALFNKLADRDQILRDGWYMRDILNVCLVTFFAEWVETAEVLD